MKKIKPIILVIVVISICVSSLLTVKPKVAKADISQNICTGTNKYGEIACNLITFGDSSLFMYGTYGFWSPTLNRQAESFCIELGPLAGGKYAVDAGALNYTGVGRNYIGIKDMGLGSDDANARYLYGRLYEMYFSGNLDAIIPGQDSLMVGAQLVAREPSISIGHVNAAAALSWITHAWFDTSGLTSKLDKFLSALPNEYVSLANALLNEVASPNMPDLSNSHIAISGDKLMGVLDVSKVDGSAGNSGGNPGGNSGSNPAGDITWKIDGNSQNVQSNANGNYIAINYTPLQTIRVCAYFRYFEMNKTDAGSDQDGTYLNNTNGQIERCQDKVLQFNFQLSLRSDMLRKLYVTGDIIDRIYYNASGSWPCSFTSDPQSMPGACKDYAVFNASHQLYKISAPNAGASNAEVNGEAITNVPITYGVSYKDVNYGTRAAGFYASKTRITFVNEDIIHNDNLLDQSQIVSTYKCSLTHTSRVDSYKVDMHAGNGDDISIGGRCGDVDLTNYTDGGSNVFREFNTAEVLVYGPLKTRPSSNSSTSKPTLDCKDVANCILFQKNVLLENGSFHIGDYDNQITPNDSGIYVFVYHFVGDVYTPQFWSNAADGNETFFVDNGEIMMWSAASGASGGSGADSGADSGGNSSTDSDIQTGDPIRDEVYIVGDIPSGSYLEISAYGPFDPKIPVSAATCSVTPLLDGSGDRRINVVNDGGHYTSATISAPQIGNIYWQATLFAYDGQIIDQGECGEAPETTHVNWDVGITSKALANVPMGSSITDLVNVSSRGNLANTVPKGAIMKWELYFGGEIVSVMSLPLSKVGDITSPSYIAKNPGKYYWVASIVDIWGNTITSGVLGDPTEISSVFEVTSDVSHKTIQSGSKIVDNFHIQGAYSSGLYLVPILHNDKEVVHTYSGITLIENIQEYSLPEYVVSDVGSYYFTYNLYESSVMSKLIDSGQPNDVRESFNVVDTFSNATPEVYIGENFHDEVTLLGKFPHDACVLWELYNQSDNLFVNDKLVKTSNCVAILDENTVISPEFMYTVPGNYYFVEKVYLGESLLTSGKPRLPNETVRVKPLIPLVSVYTETPSSAYVGEDFYDTANISGRMPEGGWMIWHLYREDTRSAEVLNDELVWTSDSVPLSDGVWVSGEAGANGIGEGILRLKSPKLSLTELGRYYWVEVLYSPSEPYPVAVGKPRLPNETIDITPHTGIFSVYSETTDFVSVGASFSDVVFIHPNVDGAMDLIDGGWVEWDIYSKNLASTNASDDKLVYHIGPVSVSESILQDDGVSVLSSPMVSFDTPGAYYWVESLYSPNSDQPLSVQKMRDTKETVIVEADSNSYLRIGKRGLAITGSSLPLMALGGALGAVILSRRGLRVFVTTSNRKKSTSHKAVTTRKTLWEGLRTGKHI